MANVEKSITINAPAEKVFDYLNDPLAQLEWVPSIMEVKDVSGSGVGRHFKWKYKMAGILLEGESTVTEYIPNKRIVTQSKGGATSTWTFNLEPHNGETRVKLTIEYTIPVPVLGRLAEKIVLKRNEREADLAMTNIKEKMEA